MDRADHVPAKEQHAIEMLARETATSVDKAEEVYVVERAKLELVARIKTYVPVLAARRAKIALLSGNEADAVH
jgi:hypothetical protein